MGMVWYGMVWAACDGHDLFLVGGLPTLLPYLFHWNWRGRYITVISDIWGEICGNAMQGIKRLKQLTGASSSTQQLSPFIVGW